MSTALNTLDDWRMELTFIKSIDTNNPGTQFNNDPACFGRYCAMQCNRAQAAGHHIISDEILLHALGVASC